MSRAPVGFIAFGAADTVECDVGVPLVLELNVLSFTCEAASIRNNPMGGGSQREGTMLPIACLILGAEGNITVQGSMEPVSPP